MDDPPDVRNRWRTLAADETGATFARHATDDVSVAGSAFLRPVRGRTDVWLTLRAAAAITDRVRLTHTVTTGTRTYVEWQAEALGLQLAGVAVVVVTADGLLQAVTIDQRPLSAVLACSVALRRRLLARTDPTFFYRGRES